MYVVKVPNRGSPPAVLLRESFREDGKVKNRTLANLSRWPEAKVEGDREARPFTKLGVSITPVTESAIDPKSVIPREDSPKRPGDN